MSYSLIQKLEQAHQEGIWCCKWGKYGDDPVLVSGSCDESVTIWDFKQDEQSKEFKIRQLVQRHQYTGHRLGVISVDVASFQQPLQTIESKQEEQYEGDQDISMEPQKLNQVIIASNSLDSFVRIWDLGSGKTKTLIENGQSESWQVKFHPQYFQNLNKNISSDDLYGTNTSIVAVSGGTTHAVNLFNPERKQRAGQLILPDLPSKYKENQKFVLSVAFSLDGLNLACGCMDGRIIVFDLETQQVVQQIHDHHKPVRCLEFGPNNCLLSGSDDMYIHMHDYLHGELIDSFSGHKSWILDLAWHPDGKSFVSASADSKVKLWSYEQRSTIEAYNNHRDMVWGVDFDSTGKYLATVSDDKAICIYERA